MFAMAGARRVHNLVAGNTEDQLRHQLRQGPCEVYQSDMQVQVSVTGMYTYPDVVVACGPEFVDEQQYTLLNPVLIVEVLSPSTELFDRGDKFKHYRTIPSLREYLLVASEHIEVELRRLQPDGEWTLRFADRIEDVVELQSIGCRLALADLYERVEFSERPPGMRPMFRS
jgi:Uma2 family endonuclease